MPRAWHSSPGKNRATKRRARELDYAALATFPGTLVFYMGVTTAPEWSRALIAHGKPPQTPVAIVRRCSLPISKRSTRRWQTIGE